MHGEESLGAFTSEVAAALTRPVKASEASCLITHVAVDRLALTDFASICLSRAEEPVRIVASTDPRVLEADRLQHELGEGPCLDVMVSMEPTRSLDIAKDSRWPLYGPKVAASGIAAQTTLPLPMSGGTRACLNLYSLTTGTIGGVPAITDMFTTHAAVALSYSLQMQDLGEALGRRQMLGQAVGIVMQRYGIDEDAAFAFLTRASQTGNVKLRHIAAKVVATVEENARRRG